MERILDATDAFTRVSVIVKCGKILGLEGKCRFVERQRVASARLSMGERRCFIGQAALNPEPGIAGTFLQRVAYGLALRDVGVLVRTIFRITYFRIANCQPGSIASLSLFFIPPQPVKSRLRL